MLLHGHKYLGPGNKVPNGTPIDFDDYLAYLHDCEYIKQNIEQSDYHYASDFLSNFLEKKNSHSFIGFLGLYSKYLFEKQFGRVYPHDMPRYPKTPKELHKGQQLYANRQRQLGRDYQQARNRGWTGSWHDWLRTQGERTSQVNPVEVVPPFIPQATTAIPSSTTTAAASQIAEPAAGPSRASEDTFDFDLDAMFDESMHLDEVQGLPAASSGGGVANAITGQESAVKYLRIPRSLGLKSYTLHFRKSRIFYSYGYAFTPLIKKRSETVNGQVLDIGEKALLCSLPVDMIGFYLNLQECNLLDGNNRILEVKVSVVPQGLRTAFDFGTTLSGTATSEHCSIGCSAIGLNMKVYGVHSSYTSATDKPMIPTDVIKIDPAILIDKYYGTRTYEHDSLGMHLGIPRHTNFYFQVMSNTNNKPTGPHKDEYLQNAGGWPKIDNYYSRWSFTPRIGEQIIDYSYKPINGMVHGKAHAIPYGVGQSDQILINNATVMQNTTVLTVRTPSTKPVDRQVAINVRPKTAIPTFTTHNYRYEPNSTSILTASIDPVRQYNPHGKAVRTKQIPLVYFGVFPVPQLNPAQDQTNFQNTCAYFSVVADMYVECNSDSIFPLEHRIYGTNDDFYLRQQSGDIMPNNYAQLQPFNGVTYTV